MSHWRGCLLGTILLSSIAAGGCGPTQANSKDQTVKAGLVVEPVEIDLGKCRMGVAAPFHAELVNHGKEVVKIDGVEPSCGCTNVQISGNRCEPGGRITLTGSLRGDTKAGKFRHRITVYEAGAAHEEHTLYLVGVVEATIQVRPEAVTLTPSLMEGKGGEAVLVVTNTGDEMIHLQQPVRLPDGVTGEVEKAELKPGEKTNVILRVGCGQLGELDAEAALPTSHPLEGLISILIKVRPKESIRVLPNAILLGVVQKTALLKSGPLVIRVMGEGLSLMEVVKVECPEFLKCEQVAEPSGVALRCTVLDRFPGIDLKSTIVVTLKRRTPKAGLPEELTLEIPVSGILAGP